MGVLTFSFPLLIERLFWNFLWKEGASRTGIHLVNWNKILLSLDKGSLNLCSLKDEKRALFVKWIWCYNNESDAIWRKLIKGKYGSTSDCVWTNYNQGALEVHHQASSGFFFFLNILTLFLSNLPSSGR